MVPKKQTNTKSNNNNNNNLKNPITIIDCSSTSVKEGKELIQKYLSQNLLIVFSHYFDEAHERTERG